MFIKHLDFLSPKLTLFHDKKIRHVSFVSGVLSIITVWLSIAFFLLFLSEYLNHQNPTTYFYNKYVNESGTYPLNSEQIFHYFTMYNAIIDPQILTIIGINVFINSFSQDPRPEAVSHWVYSPCTEKNALPNYPELYQRDFNTSYCINQYYNNETGQIIDITDPMFAYPTISKDIKNENMVLYGIIIQKCKNSTILNKHCKSPSEIDEYLSKNYVVDLKFFEYEIDITDYSTPVKPRIYSISNSVFNGTYTINHLNYRPALVISHIGMIFDSTSTLTTYTFDQNEKITYEMAPGEDIICGYYFWIQNQWQIYERNYSRLQETLGSFGGWFDLIMMCASIINSWYSKWIALNEANIILSKIHFKRKDNWSNVVNSSCVNGYTSGFKIRLSNGKENPSSSMDNNNNNNNIIINNKNSKNNNYNYKCNTNTNNDSNNNSNINISNVNNLRSNNNILLSSYIKYPDVNYKKALPSTANKCKSSEFKINVDYQQEIKKDKWKTINPNSIESPCIGREKLSFKETDSEVTLLNYIKWWTSYNIKNKKSNAYKMKVLNDYYRTVISEEELFSLRYDVTNLKQELFHPIDSNRDFFEKRSCNYFSQTKHRVMDFLKRK